MPEEIPERPVSLAALSDQMAAHLILPYPDDFVSVYATDLLWAAKIVRSRSEAKRLLLQGAIEIDGKRVSSDYASIKNGSVIKVGKRRFVKIVDADK